MKIIPTRTSIPSQEPEDRIHNFDEVILGYTPELAQAEAERCLHCKTHPCVDGCPVHNNIPDFIAKIKEGDYEGAYQIIRLTSSLPAVCGRVCPQENQCEGACTMGVRFEPVAIGRLERFVADWHNANVPENPEVPESNGHRVAVVGSGPAGISCAGDLAKLGYSVTIFEALPVPGGVMQYGIPEFRLPKAVVRREIEKLRLYGVEIKTGVEIGRDITVAGLFAQGYEAVFLGNGAEKPIYMDIPGENSIGVYSANEELLRANLKMDEHGNPAEPLDLKDKLVAICGGGNVAMDAASTAVRLGAKKVFIVYRRTLNELPARKEEVQSVMDEGVEFRLLQNPVEILNDPETGKVVGMRCIRMELGEPDESGRRRPVPVEGSEFVMDADIVIMAIGTKADPKIASTTDDLQVNRKGLYIIDENGKTSRKGVFAGGDDVTGPLTVISAMKEGKAAARSIDIYLT